MLQHDHATRCFKVHDRGPAPGPRDRYCVEVYHFYPQAGPEGTPGRGPYCLAWVDVPASWIDSAKAQLAASGAVSLDHALAVADAFPCCGGVGEAHPMSDRYCEVCEGRR